MRCFETRYRSGDDEGNKDTHWITLKEMAEGAGLVQTDEKLTEYEQKYVTRRKAHFVDAYNEMAAFQGLCAGM